MQNLFRPVRIIPVQKESYRAKAVSLHALRLDEIHPIISGNKWFKLKAYLADAAQQGKQTILTFGGAYSNHILATAALCAASGFSSIGIIRGEKPNPLSPTLADAAQYGMHFHFISREAYRLKQIPEEAYGLLKKLDVYVINEGGYGDKGREGSMDILKSCDTENYTHIIAAVGTGTMLSGLVCAALPTQEIIGISVLKKAFSVAAEIQNLLPPQTRPFTLLHDFHFGGYAKHTPLLLQFMNDWFTETCIPTDFVYTAKTFYAADALINAGYFKKGSRVLVVQSGGLQGNRSLPAGALQF
ncbi:MAG TPA: pyridoxal-phosphate dependent enzyme [Chitinophagaceae bacterium]|nr:pyridoxal-phosphate dependent enzyme [Chitinophagaceae bacterium]